MERIRKAVKADLETVISWIPDREACNLWAGPRVRYPLSADSLEEDIRFAEKNSYYLESGGAVKAFGQLFALGGHRFHLARIVVEPSSRGQGYGKKLCLELLEIALRRGAKAVSLRVYRDNTRALKLYEGLGFREGASSSKDACFLIKTWHGSDEPAPLDKGTQFANPGHQS